MSYRVTRRDLLGLLGLGAVSAGIAGAGGVAYLLLNRAPSRAAAPAPPTATAPRPPIAKAIDRPPIITRAEWGARPPDHEAANETGFYGPQNNEGWLTYGGDLRTTYRTVVVHHSALYEDDDATTMREIQTEHMDERQWADVGYHFGVGRTGAVFEGRDLGARGTHVEHYNTGSVGVVFFGNFALEAPTAAQIDAGSRLINWLALRLELTHLAGHFEFNDFTVCPGPTLIYYLDTLTENAGLARGTGGYVPPADQAGDGALGEAES